MWDVHALMPMVAPPPSSARPKSSRALGRKQSAQQNPLHAGVRILCIFPNRNAQHRRGTAHLNRGMTHSTQLRMSTRRVCVCAHVFVGVPIFGSMHSTFVLVCFANNIWTQQDSGNGQSRGIRRPHKYAANMCAHPHEAARV